jgi:hypothetical protein
MKYTKANEYKCEMCNNIYEFGRSDEEAKKEAGEIWGEEMVAHGDMAIICDDCFQKMNPKAHPLKVEKTKTEFYGKRN